MQFQHVLFPGCQLSRTVLRRTTRLFAIHCLLNFQHSASRSAIVDLFNLRQRSPCREQRSSTFLVGKSGVSRLTINEPRACAPGDTFPLACSGQEICWNSEHLTTPQVTIKTRHDCVCEQKLGLGAKLSHAHHSTFSMDDRERRFAILSIHQGAN